MDKFVWKAGDIKIARTQCELCLHNCKETPNKCPKFEIKPAEVIEGKVKCPYIKLSSNTPW